jgi:hypothetical protein
LLRKLLLNMEEKCNDKILMYLFRSEYRKYTLVFSILFLLFSVIFGSYISRKNNLDPRSNANTVSTTASISLWYPRQATPAFVKPGEEFTAIIRGSSTLNPTGWIAKLTNDQRSWTAIVTGATYGKEIQSWKSISTSEPTMKEKGWELKLKVPADVSPELFKLTITHTTGGTVESTHAVSVIIDYEKDFYILNLTDEQAWRWTLSSSEYSTGAKSFKVIRDAADAISLINPRFVINTGDLVEDPWIKDRNNRILSGGADSGDFTKNGCNNTEYLNLYDSYLCSKKSYKVATVTLPGNHDIPREDWIPGTGFIKDWGTDGYQWHADIAQEYEKAFGQRAVAYKMGSFFLVAHDYFEWRLKCQQKSEKCPSDKYGYTAQEYTNSFKTDSGIKYRVVAQHWDDSWMSFNPENSLSNFSSSQNPNMMLLGHSHSTDRRYRGNYPVLITTAAYKLGSAGFIEYKKDNATGGWTSPSVSLWEDEGESDESEIIKLLGTYNTTTDSFPLRIRSNYQVVNDGSKTSNTATITNDTQKSYYDGRIKFLMAKGNYKITGGEKLAQYDYDNGTKTALLVKVNIKNNSNTTVSIALDSASNPTSTPTPTLSGPSPISTPTPLASNKANGDFNYDNKVDILDLSILATYWMQNQSTADANNNGIVDLADLSILAANWGRKF